MEKISESLERHYKAFIGETARKAFFLGLISYTKFALDTPILKKVFDKEFSKRNREYKKLDEIEAQTRQELEKAKGKLLAIVKKRKINPTELTRNTSHMFMPLGEERNVLLQLEMFEKGEIGMSGFFSHNLERFLFDIAVGIKSLGYENDLKEFLVSDIEYGNYNAEINGKSGGFGGNIYGNFIFSKTLPARYKQGRVIEAQRKMETWGAFEMVIKVWRAYNEALKDADVLEILDRVRKDNEYPLPDKGAVDVVHATEEWKLITRNDARTANRMMGVEINFLNVEDFKIRVVTVHNILLQAIPSYTHDNQITREAKTKAFKRKIEEAWRESVDSKFGRLMTFMEDSLAEKKSHEEEEQEILGGKWWKDTDKPIYDKKNCVIILADRNCPIPKRAINQRVICEALLLKTSFGSWVEELDVIYDFLKGEESKRSLADAVRLLNNHPKKHFGIIRMFEYDGDLRRVRIKPELFGPQTSVTSL